MVNDSLKKLQKGDRVMFPVDKLIHPDYNPRKISPDAMEGLKSSIERFGIVQEIVVNKRNGHIIGGNQRVDAAIAKGIKEVPIYVEDIPESEEKVLNVTLNNLHIQGKFDNELLEPLLEEIQEDIGEEDYNSLLLDDIIPTPTDVNEEWQGMPEYESENLGAFKQIIVSFKTAEDVQDFAKLLRQKIHPKTKSIWFPQVEIDSTKDIRYADAE